MMPTDAYEWFAFILIFGGTAGIGAIVFIPWILALRRFGKALAAERSRATACSQISWHEAAWNQPGRLTAMPSANPRAFCPDLLLYEQLGEADGWRGRVVRGFFWLMRGWPT